MGWHREEAERDERVREGRRGKRQTNTTCDTHTLGWKV